MQKHLGHEKHLCTLIGNKVEIRNIKPLVNNPKYICEVCGRTANNRENVCAPTKL